MTMKMGRVRALPWWWPVIGAAMVFTACGRDAPEARSGAADSSVSPASLAAAPSIEEPAAEAVTGTPDMPRAASTPAARTPGECPSADEVGAAYGADVELDEASAMVGAVGLVFCPYVEVLAPDATGAFGTPATPDSFSLTFTDQNPVVADGSAEELTGLGEAAEWSAGDQLAVWTGDRGLIVTLDTSPPGGDARAAAIALAKVALP